MNYPVYSPGGYTGCREIHVYNIFPGSTFDLTGYYGTTIIYYYTLIVLQRNRQWNKSDVPLTVGKVTTHECSK